MYGDNLTPERVKICMEVLPDLMEQLEIFRREKATIEGKRRGSIGYIEGFTEDCTPDVADMIVCIPSGCSCCSDGTEYESINLSDFFDKDYFERYKQEIESKKMAEQQKVEEQKKEAERKREEVERAELARLKAKYAVQDLI